VVDCTGLENRRWETIREFESHRFRQKQQPPTDFALGGFFVPVRRFPDRESLIYLHH
jgi:hypothetical protein